MSVLRWPLCVIALFAVALTGTSRTQTAAADEPTIEWVRTSSDTVVDIGSLEAMEAAQAEDVESAESSSQFAAVTLGDGFDVFGLRSYGDYTVRLVDSAPSNIEIYRTELEQMANEINAHNGLSIVVAAGTIPAPANPNNLNAPTGEIWVMISSTSPCGTLSGGALGCGGIRGSALVDGQQRWTAGAVWLNPSMNPSCEQVVINHEIGHAMGLDHFDSDYLGLPQVMKSSTNCAFSAYRAGDLNGLRWLAEPNPSNDLIAGAALVCPGDSSVSASTWFAMKESGESAHAGAGPRRSVWYLYVPRPEQHGAVATISTANDGVDDFDTVLAVYSGSLPTTPVVSDDNAGPGGVSLLTFPVDSAETYWIAIDGVGFARGETDVVFDLPPVNDDLVPLCAPARVLDTRVGGDTIDEFHEGVGRIQANGTYQLPIAGRASIPAGADSVVLNVTAVSPSANGFVTVYPCGETRPNASNLNFTAGEVIPNAVLARIGVLQSVCFFSSTETDLLVDVSAYFPTSAALVPLAAPGRLLDTRVGGSTIDGNHQGVGRIPADGTYELPVLDRAGVSSSATTVVLNVTAVQPLANGFVTVFPCGQTRPNASNLNFTAGRVIPNAVIARVGAAGKVCFYSSVATDLLVDVSGYFPTANALTPLTVPSRVLDTRSGGSTADGQHQGVGAIPAGGTYELPIASRVLVPASVVAVVLNVTVLQPSANGFVTVFACGQDRPNASSLNFRVGDVIPNAVIASVGTGGRICLYSSAQTDLLVDVSGYFP